MVGPEFISMAAGEAENPRRLMGKAFSSFVWRLMFFFIGGALCVGIVIPYDDKMLADVISGDREGSGTGAAYVLLLFHITTPHLGSAPAKANRKNGIAHPT
jgi:amino acid transporter